MNKRRDIQLETEFLQLLQDADPSIMSRETLAQEFANYLATLTAVWAVGSGDKLVDYLEQAISQWIKSNVSSSSEDSAYRERDLVGAGESEDEV